MKIAYFTYWGINEGLSQSTSIKNLVSLNSFNNIQKIHYYTFEIKKIKHDYILPEKVIHFQINRRIGSNIIDKIIDYYNAWNLLQKNHKITEYDLIIARSSFSGIFAYFLFLKYKIPFVVESFEPHSDYQINIPNGWSKYGIRYTILNIFEFILKKKSKLLLPVSNSYKKALIAEGILEKKIIVQPCCIDYSVVKFDDNIRNQIRKELKIPNENLVGIYVGKFGGIYYENEAFDLIGDLNILLKRKFSIILLTPNDNLFLINQLTLRGLEIENINILYVEPQLVYKYLMAADFGFNFHISSKVSNCFSPIKNGEYWSVGLPIIIPTNIGDDSNIIQKYNLGIVHDFKYRIDEFKVEQLQNLINYLNIRDKIINKTIQFRSVDIIKKSYEKMFKILQIK